MHGRKRDEIIDEYSDVAESAMKILDEGSRMYDHHDPATDPSPVLQNVQSH